MKFIRVKPCNYVGDPVAQNLSIPPQQMLEMTRQGVAISPQNVNPNSFFDGTEQLSFDVPLDQKRGVDIADMWEYRQTMRKKFSDAHLKQVAIDKSNANPE